MCSAGTNIHRSFTAHEIVDDGVDGAVEVAETVRDQRERQRNRVAHADLGVSTNQTQSHTSPVLPLVNQSEYSSSCEILLPPCVPVSLSLICVPVPGHCVQMTSSINRKYITHCDDARRGSSHGHRKYAEKFCEIRHAIPDICWQTDTQIQTNTHIYIDTLILIYFGERVAISSISAK